MIARILVATNIQISYYIQNQAIQQVHESNLIIYHITNHLNFNRTKNANVRIYSSSIKR